MIRRPVMNRCIASFTLAVVICIPVRTQAGPADKTLDIYWVDSEGGGSTLVVTPAGESVLIDSGNPGGRDSRRIHQVATGAAALKKIDYLVTTHFHIDHFGGAAELSQLMPIGAVYDNGIPEHNPDGGEDASFFEKIKPYRDFKADKRRTIKSGELIPLKQTETASRVSLRCLAAKQQFGPATESGRSNPLCSESKDKPADTC